MALMKALEKAVTVVKASDIMSADIMLVVTANAEQIPSTWSVIGLLSTRGSITLFFAWLAISYFPNSECMFFR
jgi:hypothetical protein